MIELQKDIDIRTEIAFKQEILVKEKEAENSVLLKRLQQLQDEFHKTTQEHRDIAISLRSLQENANRVEDKYRTRMIYF